MNDSTMNNSIRVIDRSVLLSRARAHRCRLFDRTQIEHFTDPGSLLDFSGDRFRNRLIADLNICTYRKKINLFSLKSYIK